ncbi:MAG: IPT/TIG domain-containing protein [Elusimicrobia bacterium]|nr:IPT/TIG domain-containing protein [Elusimicrobiota bacterium]
MLLTLVTFGGIGPAFAGSYDSGAAASYADDWCGLPGHCGHDDRFNTWDNILDPPRSFYYNSYGSFYFQLGGDCANYVSQCLVAGGLGTDLEQFIANSSYQALAGRRFSNGNEVICDDPMLLVKGIKCGGVNGTWASAGTDVPVVPLKEFLIKSFHAQYFLGKKDDSGVIPTATIPAVLALGDVVLLEGVRPDHSNHSLIVTADSGPQSKVDTHTLPAYHAPLTDYLARTGSYAKAHYFHMIRTVPFKKKATGRQGTRVIHQSQFEDTGSGTRSLSILADNPASGDEDIGFTLEFNESMDSVDAKAVGPSGAEVPLAGSFLDDTNTVWVGTLTATQIASASLEGSIALSVGGLNYSDSSNQLDGKPQTIATWNDATAGFSQYEDSSGTDGAGGRDASVTVSVVHPLNLTIQRGRCGEYADTGQRTTIRGANTPSPVIVLSTHSCFTVQSHAPLASLAVYDDDSFAAGAGPVSLAGDTGFAQVPFFAGKEGLRVAVAKDVLGRATTAYFQVDLVSPAARLSDVVLDPVPTNWHSVPCVSLGLDSPLCRCKLGQSAIPFSQMLYTISGTAEDTASGSGIHSVDNWLAGDFGSYMQPNNFVAPLGPVTTGFSLGPMAVAVNSLGMEVRDFVFDQHSDPSVWLNTWESTTTPGKYEVKLYHCDTPPLAAPPAGENLLGEPLYVSASIPVYVDWAPMGAPPGYKTHLPASAWDITAKETYAGPVTITANYNPDALGGRNPTELRLLHFPEGGGVEDVTVSVDEAQHTVTGAVSHLSRFMLAFPANVDDFPPRTEVVYTGIQYADPQSGVVAIGTGTTISLNGVDSPIVPGAPASGVATTYFLIDQVFVDMNATPPQVFTVPFTLPFGSHTIVYFSEDNAGNRELEKTAAVAVLNPDVTPPRTNIVFEGYSNVLPDESVVLSTSTRIALSAFDPGAPDAMTSPVDKTYFLVDRAFVDFSETPPQVYTASFTLALGTHSLAYFSQDKAGNLEAPRISSMTVFNPDTTAPQTQLVFEGFSSAQPDGYVHIATGTRAYFVAVDSAVPDALTAGLATTYFLLDQPFTNMADTPPEVFTSSFPLAFGGHSITYFSQDQAGNLEASHVASITVLNADTTPPQTQIVFEGYSSTQPAGAVRITTYTQISFAAADPEVPDALTSGLDKTVYAVGEDPPQDFTGAFTLPFGTHTVTYFSQDKALNLETPKAALLEVVDLNISTQPPSEPGSGYALSADAAGNLWAVVRFDSGYKLAKFGPGGAGLASVELPGVGGWGDWSVSFDASGNAYAIGSGINTATGGNTVAIYKTAASGDVLLSSAGFMSAYGKNDYAMDSAGDIWITGAVQTSGPPDFSGPVEFSLALWKFSPADGLLTLTTTYTRGAGLDMGYGIRLDGQGNIWLAGYSINPGAAGPNIIDLGAWKYDWTGTGLARQPVFLPGYASDPMGQFTAKVAVSSDAAYVAGNHATAGGGYDLSFAKLDLQGNVVLEKTWAVDGGGNSFPWGMARDASGSILVAGSTKDKLAVWRYGANGALISAQTIEGVDGAKDIAVKGSEIWLSVSNSSAPLRFTGGTALAGSEVLLSSQATAPSVALNPTAGPIGVPFTITGTGFGAYNGSNTRVKFGTVSAALSVWNNTTISGTVPGLSTGSYAVAVERQHPSSATAVAAGLFAVTALELWSMAPSSGPIGAPFTIRGPSFGPYNGANTRVLIGATTAPLSLWNETTISGTVPGLAAGQNAVRIERQSGSMVSASNSVEFLVTVPQVGSLTPSSGPIGAPFTITGTSFGPYSGANTRVLIGGTTAPLSLWNDTTISGTIPGLSPGIVPVLVERAAAGGLVSSNTSYFEVTLPSVASISPSSGPIGVVFTLIGTSFGPYNGANTQVLIGTSTAALSLWNDTTIKGAVPGTLGPGPYPVVVRRKSADGGVVETAPVFFHVAGLYLASISPSSGPIGAPFTITGMDFDSYGGANTRVLFNGTTSALSLWTDTQIKGTVPALDAGVYDVLVERQSGTGVARSNSALFTVGAPQAEGISPTAGPIGVPFTIAGTGFGPYNGANTRVLIGGTTAPLSLWSDTTISGTIPGLSPGIVPVMVERLTSDGGSVQANGFSFEVLALEALALSPSSGPIGVPFTITGRNFGPYNGSYTRVLIGATTAALSLWNDTTITGAIPGLSPGIAPVIVERAASDGGLAQVQLGNFQVTVPEIASLTPSSGPIGAPFTITGTSFGSYNGANTRVLIGGTTAALSLWNDSKITGRAPNLAAGTHSLVLQRESGGTIIASTALDFTVVSPEALGVEPSSGPIGMPFTITGSGFGPYDGANTRVKIGGLNAPLSLWNDTAIKGAVPGGLATGSHSVRVERASSDGGLATSDAGTFQVLRPEIYSVTPASAPIGDGFTIAGAGFGPYNGVNTRVLIGGTTAPLSLWNDATIKGKLPYMSAGTYAVVVERAGSDGGLVRSNEGSIQVVRPVISTITPAVALQGTPFELTGTGFGQYAGTATRVLIGGATTSLSLWNDTRIRGLVPDTLPDALYAVVVQRDALGGTVTSEPVYFIVDPPGSIAAPAAPAWFGEAALVVSTETGGKVAAPSRASVDVPPAALDEEVVISVSRPKDADDESKREKAAKAQPIAKAGEPVEFGPEGTRFNYLVTVELPFDQRMIPPGKGPDDVVLHYWNKGRGEWEPLETDVDPVKGRVRALTNHFSVYQAMVTGVLPEAVALSDFEMREVYAFPNPARKGESPTIRVQVGWANSVEVKIFDSSGRKVHAAGFGYPSVMDDGNGKDDQYTYDYRWDAGGVGSGVYTYVVTAKRVGQSDITIIKKLAIIK